MPFLGAIAQLGIFASNGKLLKHTRLLKPQFACLDLHTNLHSVLVPVPSEPIRNTVFALEPISETVSTTEPECRPSCKRPPVLYPYGWIKYVQTDNELETQERRRTEDGYLLGKNIGRKTGLTLRSFVAA